jgi:glycosyltransferase involved in cell wall biosynthesis
MRREPALSDAVSFISILRFFRRHRCSLAQTHTPKASMIGLPAARLAGIPCIYTVHGALFFRGNDRLANLLGWLFEKWCCTWARLVIVQSQEDYEQLPRARLCRRSKLAYLGNGIDMGWFFEPVDPALDTDRPVVLMVSRLVREKGCDDFFNMARALHDRAAFVHVGPREPDQRDRISDDEIARLGSDATVVFVGPVGDVRPYLSSATVVVLPSYREGMPRVAMEAAAMGKPIAAYDVRGTREVIPAETGLLVARGDINRLIEVVTNLIDDPRRASELGGQCQKWVVERFDERHVVARLRAIYRRFGVAA